MRIKGLVPGFASLTLDDEQGHTYNIDVLVTADIRQFDAFVRLAVPGAAIQAVKVKDNVMLLGQVDQPEHVRKIVEIAEVHFPKVLNYLTVKGGQATTSDAASPLGNLPLVGKLFDRGHSQSGDTATSRAAQEYHQHESRARELANAYRQQQATAPQDAKTLDQLKQELQSVVNKAFRNRQTWQRSQAAQLRVRLEQIERRITERESQADEVIQRRIEELLHPEQQWEQENDTAAVRPDAADSGAIKSGTMRNIQQNNSPITDTSAAPEELIHRPALTPARPTDLADSSPAKKSVEKKCWETLGLRLEKTDASQLDAFRNRYRRGMRVIDVRPKSIAAESGIKNGDILVGLHVWETVRWEDINYILDQTNLLKADQPLKFHVIRGQEVLYGNLKPASAPASPSNTTIGDRAANRLASDLTTRAVRELDSPANPHRRVLDAELELDSARAAVDRSQALLADSQQYLQRLRQKEETIPQKMILDAERDENHKMREFEKTMGDLKIKQRQVKKAREMLAAQVKFLEIDLADAKLRLRHADDDLSRAQALYKRSAMSQEEYDAKFLARQLAESQLERAQLLLDLYRKAVPGRDASAEKGPSDAPNVWMTDFAAAQKMALKLHRPLIAYYWADSVELSRKMKDEVLNQPLLNQTVAERLRRRHGRR